MDKYEIISRSSEDSQSQINALREELDQLKADLQPKPAKTSSMQVSGELKECIKGMQMEGEKQEDIIWMVIKEAERVPELEKENLELKKRIAEFEKEGE